MKPVYKVVTPGGQYVAEVFEHPTAGFVWQVDGKRVAYAIPTNFKTSKVRLQFQVCKSFDNMSLLLEVI